MSTPSARGSSALPRALGWLTAAYGAAIIVRPKLLAAPCAFVDRRGEVARPTATAIAAVGARDVASGLMMALAPAGTPLRTAIAIRVVADLGDAVLFGIGVQGGARAARVAGAAAAWGALCAASARTAG